MSEKTITENGEGSSNEMVPSSSDSEGDFLSDLMRLMATNEFRTFQSRHMQNAAEARTSFVYFELYRAIEEIYEEMLHEPIPENVGRAILRAIMKRKAYRKPLVNTILEYMEGEMPQQRHGELRQKIHGILRGRLLTIEKQSLRLEE